MEVSTAQHLAVMLVVGLALITALPAIAADWTPVAPRDEIRPDFAREATGGREGGEALVITMDQREGLHGWWSRTFSVTGGQWYKFRAYRRLMNVPDLRRMVAMRVFWSDATGQPVPHCGSVVRGYLKGWTDPAAECEHPRDGATDAEGWTEVGGVYRAPDQAVQARVELGLQGAPGGSVAWSEASVEAVEAPPPRRVRLATIHYCPGGGKSPADNCRQYEPYIAEAARQKADLVVLGEVLTSVGLGGKPHDWAEPIPGPSTRYFGRLARKHNMYIVPGLLERDGHLVYNVAVLIGPDGEVVGKYRKVCLPRGEDTSGVTPGTEYPVFSTRFGKVGMMICYDGFFPEVAQQLVRNGAEVIAWPVWGCNPELAAARALDNQVYLVSSTYEAKESNWMLSAVWGHDGRPLASAKEWRTVAVAEVDLNARTFWPCLGHFGDAVWRHQP